jgi:hypothetical protein
MDVDVRDATTVRIMLDERTTKGVEGDGSQRDKSAGDQNVGVVDHLAKDVYQKDPKTVSRKAFKISVPGNLSEMHNSR